MPEPKFKISLSFRKTVNGEEAIEKIQEGGFDTPYAAFLVAEDTALIDDTLEIHITRDVEV